MSWERCRWYEAVHHNLESIAPQTYSHTHPCLHTHTLFRSSHAQGEEAVAAAAAWVAKREAEAARLDTVWANASDKVGFFVG